jgi:pimeloyl-ACP methyl ester carboxylesterase
VFQVPNPKRDRKADKPSGSVLRHVRGSDLRAVAKLAGSATLGIQEIVEETHQAVLGSPQRRHGAQPGRTSGLTGLIYRAVRSATTLIAQGVDKALALTQPLIEMLEEEKQDTSEREMMLAILNGVLGDHLAETNNAFVTPMSVRWGNAASSMLLEHQIPQARGKLVILLHGLCLNERIWQPESEGESADLGTQLQVQLGYQPLYLRYNSGLHISQNGRELANKIEALIETWPVPVEEITLIGFSMGGLVARSAVHIAQTEAMKWPSRLKNMVFLATPHHGSPLEKAGNWFEAVLGKTPYSAPFARLGKLRSAGITDLRYGSICDEDWCNRDRFNRQPDNRAPVPLPENVHCFTVAATMASKRSRMIERLTGDGLVLLDSALGRHEHPGHALKFAKDDEMIVYRLNHMAVPTDPAVIRQVLTWLSR